MKERPILFSGPLVRAILNGSKTQTRRLAAHPDRPCPYGVAGDRLWVRETWRSVGWRPENGYWIEYKEGARKEWREAPSDVLSVDVCDDAHPDRWRPSIFMFRWASRITLEVTGTRLERLQDITEEDARAEGIAEFPAAKAIVDSGMWTWKAAFASVWNHINGERASWGENPLVWAVSFKVVPQ